jgi:putative membrane protein
MIASTQPVLQLWSPPIAVNASLCMAILVFVTGWIRLRRAFPGLISARRLAAFLVGIAAIWFAIGSPLEAFDEASLTLHMVQHLLLMSIAPPLILLGWPALPLLRGLPPWIVRRVVGPISRSASFKWLANAVTHPFLCWFVAALALVVWHVPSVFEAALQRAWLHELEHALFLAAGLLFWWPVVQPWPSASRWPRWTVVLYLFCATLPCDVLSAFLVFCGRVVYPSYLSAPSILGISALQDQECAAALMWVSITLILLIPAAIVTIEMLSPKRTLSSEAPRAASAEIAESDAYAAR